MVKKFSSDFLTWTERKFKPEVVFVIIALIAGGCLIVATGPFQVNDEVDHFRRAYQVYQGQVVASRQGNSVGGYIPRDIATANLLFDSVIGNAEIRIDTQALSEKLHEPFETTPQCFSHFLMPAVYSPTLYIPQAIGISIGRLWGLSAIGMMYSGRVMNLICWIVVIFLAMRMVPVFNWTFLLVALLPMNLALAASLSADASANAMALLLVALVLRLTLVDDGRFNRWTKGVVVGLCIFLSLAKQAYFPLTGLVILIPSSRFGGLRNKMLYCGVCLGISLAAALLWSAATKGLFVTFYGGNLPEQMDFLFGNPWGFPKIVIDSIGAHWNECSFAWIGVLGFLDTWLPKWIYWSYPFVLILAALQDKGRAKRLGWLKKIWIVCIVMQVYLLIDLSLYLIWTPPGADKVHGVQGRYFLPLVIPVLLILYNHGLKLPKLPGAKLAAIAYSITVLIATCLTVYARYYGRSC
jgi:uncharacterized membrane protein